MRQKRISAVCLALAMGTGLGAGTGTALPLTALAGSPEFAYTAEKWASLRDDKLEFGEIADLVHEYNNTVIQNQIEYKDYRDQDKDDISDDYYEAAQDILNNLDYPDPDEAGFASRLSSYLSSKVQADNLMEKGDDNVDDGEIKKLGYDKTEAGLVKSAQEQMISYWKQVYSLDSLNASKQQAELSLQSVNTKLAAGMSVQSELLTARDAVDSAQASIISAQSGVDKTKESLCLMLGWTYGAAVEIGPLPEPELDRIAAIDPEADVERGLANSYSLKILQKQLANAAYGSTRDKLEQSLKSQRESAANGIKNSYRNLLLAKDNYDQALQAFALEQDNMRAAETKMAAGTITPNAYQKQQTSYAVAETSVKTKQLDLLNAQVDYDWSVNGLAGS